jgi:ATP-dependent DNA helicase RecQ
MDLPKNIESYYQETGRAGRDGLQSDALLFFSWGDVVKLKGFAEVEGNDRQSEIMLNKLNLMGKFGELRTCRRQFLLNYFSEETTAACGNCDNCTTTLERFDGTVIAQKALSAVYRTGQRFGLSYLVDLLRGSQARTVRDEHKNLKTYGVGADISKDDWFEYFKDLISQGYLAVTEGQYPVITLTALSEGVLNGNTAVQLIKTIAKEPKKARLVADAQHPYLQGLFDELKQVRTAFAKRDNVPPYVVFSDATLVEMATYLPQNDWELRKISGVGDLKFDKYGERFLRAIKDYCLQHNEVSRIALKSPKRERKARTRRDARGKDTYQISYELFRDGRSIPEIAAERALTTTTVENHLARFVATGKLSLDELVPTEKIETIRNAIIKMNDSGALSPIKEFLGDDYSYGEIRAVMASM